MNRTRLAAGVAIPVLLAVVLAVLLLQGHRPAGEAAPAPTVAPTTTAPPPITTQPEPPKATGENWLAIMRDILTYRHSLYENPQPNLLDQIYDRRCPCYAREHRVLTHLRSRGLRYDDQGVEILKARLLGRAKNRPSDVAVEVLVLTRTQILVDKAGKLVKRTPASSPNYQDYELLRGPDGRWRVLFELPVASGRSK
ncbi:MAG TPA: hypothetical protein VIV12_18670 [Streptosporangiaceae bacterium]